MSVSVTGSRAWLTTSTGPAIAPVRGATARLWRWTRSKLSGLAARQNARRLKVTETISLGDKRFVSILEVDGEQLLIGGGAESLVLLAKLERTKRGLAAPGAETAFTETLSRALITASDSDAAVSSVVISEGPRV